ncbi:PREDICTED: pentatricopeptide repeat-containing protein At4g16390, chloroplastic-like [Brassica oleracea var. oleracea]|uniref:Smr domain-containing protein n=1 Tax=Brassica oleracea var. oleracea TaxID=109376 RepID=A0A0D3A7N7_BRAOL|nr:PREDICTED: pentatricopeptide repeat-containing protein At4g16390, chloroplastic-like [Brassica oleracea var. oleracea]
MSFHLYSSPSSLLHDPHPLCNLLSAHPKSTPRSFLSTYNPNSPPFHSRNLLQTSHVSLQESLPHETQIEKPKLDANPPGPTPKRYAWVNPNSPRASQLRRKSYDSRYSSLIKLAESLDACPPNEADVSYELTKFGSNLFEQDAVVTLNNMTNPETAPLVLNHLLGTLEPTREVILYNVTMKVFRKSKDLERSEKLFDEMLQRGVKPDNATFTTLISCARQCGLPKRAVEWFEKMPSFGCEPDNVTLATMIDAYGRAGNVEMALSLYDRARTEKWRIDPVTFSTLIRIYGYSGNYDGCLNIYEEMKSLGVKPNLVIYNRLLDSMGKAKRPWQATIIHKDLISNGFEPNWSTYAALIRAYGRARYGDDALVIYRQMKGKGMELTVILYNTLLSMCADIGYVDEAFEIFQDMKSSGTCDPDSWTFSSLVTVYSCCGRVSEAEAALREMREAGFEPTLFVLTSLIQCYGKAKQVDDVVRTFEQVLELGIEPDDRFCGCLLNVMTQTPKEEIGKLIGCVEKAKPKLGRVVKMLIEEESCEEGVFKKEASELIDSIGSDVNKAYLNCLIDLCVNLNKLEKACEILQLGLEYDIYSGLQSKSATQWSLHLKSLSLGAALTALHVWMNDLSEAALVSGEEFPPLLGINTGHGKHKYSDKGLAAVFESHLKELDAPFHEAPDKVGWFLTTSVAAKAWLESRRLSGEVSA